MSQSILKLEGDEALAFTDTLLAAFPTEAEMQDMLSRRFQKNITSFGRATTAYEDRVFYLVNNASMHNWAGLLLEEVRAEKPSNPDVIAFIARLQGAPRVEVASGSAPHLEAAVDIGSRIFDPGISARIMRWVCRITCGDVQGSGVLIHSDLVLTNHHVLESMKAENPTLEDAVCIFDHLRISAQAISPGRSVPLDNAWTPLTRPPNPQDAMPGQLPPTDAELDYAILRLSEPVGLQPMGDVSKAPPGAEPRGWMDVSVNFAKHKIKQDTPISIYQYPKPQGLDSEPLSESRGVLKESPWPEQRIRYTSTTLGGSSGSPCFNSALEFIGIHHAVDGKHPPEFNQGVPMKAILKDWKNREPEFQVQGVTPPWKAAVPVVPQVSVPVAFDPKPTEALIV